ncbi:hypothetical protein EJB05_26554 [Eragrostis curvula]|uniref:Retrotransposon Copia-like N-terminal domain-containing protein n=1 Tax=Eragrostis curvula TaxID=38414 RepID=A0A5J9UK35_9POAL|nr:hypothetical protein EJB05_26554 [Eragrostis curvula]
MTGGLRGAPTRGALRQFSCAIKLGIMGWAAASAMLSRPREARCRAAVGRTRVLSYWASSELAESHMKNIKPFNGIDFPLWKEKVQDILKSLELDYVLHKDKPLPLSSDIEEYDEKMHEYQFKLEKWEKDNKFAKRIIKRSISKGIREEFHDNEDTTASELFFLIELEHKRVSTREGPLEKN